MRRGWDVDDVGKGEGDEMGEGVNVRMLKYEGSICGVVYLGVVYVGRGSRYGKCWIGRGVDLEWDRE